jgi:uncharacterized membrane protein
MVQKTLTFQEMSLRRFNLITLFVIFSYTALLAINYNDMPKKIPFHMNLKGEMDNYMGKQFVFGLSALNVLIYVFLLYVLTKPHKLNYGDIKITQENKEQLFAKMKLTITLLNFIVAVIFSFIAIGMYVPGNKPLIYPSLCLLVFLYTFFLFRTTNRSKDSSG